MSVALLLFTISSTSSPIAVEPDVAAESAGYKVVVHEMNPVSTLSKDDLRRLFLKKITRWRHGRSVRVIDNDPKSRAREHFSRDIHGKPVHDVQRHWHRQAISGSNMPPMVKKSDEEVLAFVRANPGAIGYVSDDTVVTHCKEIRVVED